MSGQIEASSKAMIDLARDIRNSLKKITDLNQELSVRLQSLGTTFQDEGYAVIQRYVLSSQEKVSQAVPDLKHVMENIIEYARLLKESEESITK